MQILRFHILLFWSLTKCHPTMKTAKECSSVQWWYVLPIHSATLSRWSQSPSWWLLNMRPLWKQVEYFQFSHGFVSQKPENFVFWLFSENFWLCRRVPPILGHFIEVETIPQLMFVEYATIVEMSWIWYHRNQKTFSSGCFLKTFDFGDVWHQSSATLSRWRQSPRSPTAPSHLTPHLYWNLNDTICALPRRRVWIWHLNSRLVSGVCGVVGASPSQDQYWSVKDTIWEWKAPSWREDNKAEIIRLLQLTTMYQTHSNATAHTTI